MHVNIHEFDPSGTPFLDEEGDQMIGSYYQFMNDDDEPISCLIGPYRDKKAAARAAQRAYDRRDF